MSAVEPASVDRDLLEQRLAGSMQLVETTCELAELHDLDEVLQLVTEGVCKALSCERASLYLYDEARQELYTRAVTELEINQIRTPIDRGITGWVARRRKIANIPDAGIDARWNSAIDRRTGFTTRSILATPLVSSHNDRLVGVLQLLNKQDGQFDEFDEQLVQAFASHATSALVRAQLLEGARQTHQMQVAFETARNIQSSFLPSQLPDIPGYEVATWWEPAETVSGDYYDFAHLHDGRLGLIVADVSGHGMGPSLIMASVRAMWHVATRARSEPDEILSLLDETIHPDLQNGRFITCLMAVLDSRSHEVTFANAGHWPAIHFDRGSRQFSDLRATGLPFGADDDFHIARGETMTLGPGDLLLLATDGAIEIRNERDEMFGRARLERIIDENRHLPAKDLMTAIQKAVTSFHPCSLPPDDVTMMIVERKLH